MDMDPISRKMMMKKVAGFHSFDFGFLRDFFGPKFGSGSDRRRGLGIRDFQKEVWVTDVARRD